MIQCLCVVAGVFAVVANLLAKKAKSDWTTSVKKQLSHDASSSQSDQVNVYSGDILPPIGLESEFDVLPILT